MKKIILLFLVIFALLIIPFWDKIINFLGYTKTFSISPPPGWVMVEKLSSAHTKLFEKNDTREIMNFHLFIDTKVKIDNFTPTDNIKITKNELSIADHKVIKRVIKRINPPKVKTMNNSNKYFDMYNYLIIIDQNISVTASLAVECNTVQNSQILKWEKEWEKAFESLKIKRRFDKLNFEFI